MILSVITVFRLGNINDLKSTLESLKSQKDKKFEHILVISGIENESEFLKTVNYPDGHFILNKDKSIYHAMNIGLQNATGDALFFLNGGDQFNCDDAIQLILNDIENADCVVYRTLQYIGKDGYIRPKMQRLKTLLNYPAHQGFAVRTDYVNECKIDFIDHPYSIASDLYWMRKLMNDARVVVSKVVIAKFSLGGISNRPSFLTCKRRWNEEGIIAFFKEILKYFLLILLKEKYYYRLIYISKYERVELD
ncbi:MAG: hypothetical protein CMQ38_01370 [Gammaproteobacteria bacterium]|nr:hypothetical protein [Gammaproteobacteria bacterium]